MKNERFVRWQGYTIAQLTFAINIFLGFAAASLGFGFTILRSPDFNLTSTYKIIFVGALLCLCASLLCGSGAVISRLLDFRFTAKKIRNQNKENEEDEAGVFKYDTIALGKATWRLFWVEIFFLSLGLLGLIFTIFAEFALKP